MNKGKAKQVIVNNKEKSKFDSFAISHHMLFYAGKGVSIKEFLNEVFNFLSEFLQCEKIEFDFREKNKNYFCEAVFKPKHHLSFIQGIPKKTKPGKNIKILSFPVLVFNNKIGTITFLNSKRDVSDEAFKTEFDYVIKMLGIALEHRRLQVDARERVKELVCLYGISKIAVEENLSIDDILKEIVKLLPPGWLYPEVAEARIEFDGKSYKTIGFTKSSQMQRTEIIIRGVARGSIELVYTKKMPDNDFGPFLIEEKDLMEAIAKEISFIIERKISEDERQKLQEQLRHADRLSTIGKLAAGVAHELNEPIGNILGFAQLIKKNKDINNSIGEDVDKIVNASLYSRDIIRQLLIFARMMPSKFVPTNINNIVKNTISFLESRCRKEGIRVKKELFKNISEIEADSSQMTQILVNLIVNAIDAMQLGGKLLIKTSEEKDFVILFVEDDGTGMSEEVQKQIYLPFFTTKDVGQGTGLGLSVVHGIVTAHKGLISVTSMINKGTKFTVKFPKLKIKK